MRATSFLSKEEWHTDLANGVMETKKWFSGGGGFFIQYFDIIKPVYLTLINKLLMMKAQVPFALDMLSGWSQPSLSEWYLHRKHINPFIDLDVNDLVPKETLDSLLKQMLHEDPSLFELSPRMKFHEMMKMCTPLRLHFQLYVYSEEYFEGIDKDVKDTFSFLSPVYLHGDLDKALRKVDQNFTYIFSDIEMARNAAELLSGKMSHILISNDHRYNYTDNFETLKHQPEELMMKYPVCRVERFLGVDRLAIATPLQKYHRGSNNGRIETNTSGNGIS
jgi:hypothetical protein